MKSISCDPNWDSAWDQRMEICLSPDKFENPDVDAEIQTFFTSTQLARKFLCYELDGEFFNVLLIHNPNKLKLKSVISFNTQKHGLITSTLKYKKKIGIFVDKKAPKQLINHLLKLHHLSWWDRWRKLVVSNGDKISVEHTALKHGFSSVGYKISKYTPCSAYTAMVKATPSDNGR
jgi:hypothetical protein